jgi:rhodanese-related sulfurtransferase
MPLDEVRGRLAELDPARPVIVYDANGQKAYWASRILLQNGFANVSVLTGGFVVWSATQAARSFAPMF